MSVGFKLGNIVDIIGTPDFLHSFFSTISFHLENGHWGSRFPILLNTLYKGEIQKELSQEAIHELDIIQNELKNYSPESVIWDINDLEAKPRWGENISSNIANLSDYFVTSTGRDLITILRECLEELRDGDEKYLSIVSLAKF